MVDEEDAPLAEGMPVINPNGEALGKLAALLLEEGEEEAEFMLIESGGVERLVPYEAVMGIDEGELVIAVPAQNVARFPKIGPDQDPTEDLMQQAYDVFDEGAADFEDEDED